MYLSASQPQAQLFVTMTLPHGMVVRATLCQWFVRVLSGASIDVSLGSLRATVAPTALAHGLANNAVMEAVDWASARTLFANYMHLYPLQPFCWMGLQFNKFWFWTISFPLPGRTTWGGAVLRYLALV